MIGGLCGLVVGAGTGQWPRLLEHRLSNMATGVLLVLSIIFGLAVLALGHGMKKGNMCRIKWCTLLSSVVFGCTVFHLLVAGHGWYEVLFSSFLTLTALVALSSARGESFHAPCE